MPNKKCINSVSQQIWVYSNVRQGVTSEKEKWLLGIYYLVVKKKKKMKFVHQKVKFKEHKRGPDSSGGILMCIGPLLLPKTGKAG